jgi:hypothetical protein
MQMLAMIRRWDGLKISRDRGVFSAYAQHIVQTTAKGGDLMSSDFRFMAISQEVVNRLTSSLVMSV